MSVNVSLKESGDALGLGVGGRGAGRGDSSIFCSEMSSTRLWRVTLISETVIFACRRLALRPLVWLCPVLVLGAYEAIDEDARGSSSSGIM